MAGGAMGWVVWLASTEAGWVLVMSRWSSPLRGML